jgi:cytochrome b6-f complex iron-sulfur subunit
MMINDRRRFVNWFLSTFTGALFAMIFYPVARFLSPPRIPEATTREVEAGTTQDRQLIAKAFRIVRFGAEPVILIHPAKSDFRAFSAVCTHLSCIVEFHKDKGVIWCNCHNGVYDLTGKNIGGPPPRPLAPYRVNLVSKLHRSRRRLSSPRYEYNICTSHNESLQAR